MNTIGVGGPASVNLQNSQSLDLEKSLMAMQYVRISMLEDQMTSGMADIQANIGKSTQLSQLGKSLRSILDIAGGTLQFKETALTDVQSAAFREVLATGRNVGINLGPEHQSLTAGQVTDALAVIKNAQDTLSSNQQMDMLRLQSITNKRNEAFDTMTTVMKKMLDSTSFIGNMR